MTIHCVGLDGKTYSNGASLIVAAYGEALIKGDCYIQLSANVPGPYDVTMRLLRAQDVQVQR